MGCFDYMCECGGNTCPFRGWQDGGDSVVVIEVPLNDGTTIFVKGDYDSYGAVHVGEYRFYPEQFEDFFKGWLKGESHEKTSFRAKRIWTFTYNSYQEDDEEDELGVCRTKVANCLPKEIETFKVKLGKKTISKCILACKEED